MYLLIQKMCFKIINMHYQRIIFYVKKMFLLKLNLEDLQNKVYIKLIQILNMTILILNPKIDFENKKEEIIQREKKKNLEIKESYSDSNDNSTKTETNDEKEIIQKHVEIENEQQLRKNRNRRPPLKLSYYYCDTLNSSNLKNNSPSLRHRKNINYNENKLLINSIVSNIKNENKLLKQKRNETLNISNDKQNLEYSNIKNNKRNRISSTKNEENENSNTDTEILKTKSFKKSNKSKNVNKLDHTSKQHDMIKKQNSLSPTSINSTPTKSTKQKRMICETPKKNSMH